MRPYSAGARPESSVTKPTCSLRLRRNMVACLSLMLLPFTGCSPDSLVGPSFDSGASGSAAAPAVVDSGQVTDLHTAAATDSSVTLAWTEVDDGTGKPATYRVKYAEPPISWSTATIGCDRTVVGASVGSQMSCTVTGLAESTPYDFQVMSYRTVSGSWSGAVYSNVASGATRARGEVGVADLAVVSSTGSTLELRWTQVDDGTGQPASYRVKYATPTLSAWGSGVIGCDRNISGTAIGAAITCTLTGLQPNTAYQVQLMSYKSVDGVWENALYSNVAGGSTTGVTTSQQTASSGIWVDRAELMQRPTSGPDWDRLVSDAASDPGNADIADQDSEHDTHTLAAAIVCVRNGQYCAKARQGVLDAIGTESGGRWLAVGRNLGAYVIAADLLDLRSGNGSDGDRVEQWMRSWLTKRLRDNNTTNMRPFGPFHAAANAAAQEGFAYAAVAAYLGDDYALERAWDAFRRFVCAPGAPDRESINMGPSVRDNWTDADSPCSVNPKGSTRRVPSGMPGAGGTYRIDGSLPGDMRRGGKYQWRPGYTQYVWVGLEGLVPAALILDRAGYPAFDAADRAVLRTHEYLWWLRSQTGDSRWFDGVRARDIIQLVNHAYGTSFPVNQTVGGGRTVGYTGWTHPK